MADRTAAWSSVGADDVDLTPYVPRVVLEWLRSEPQATSRRLEGSLAFVDVSGFTAMSERLAAKGRLGAEEVTGVMSDVFARLLEIPYEHGGGLLKFGGDALLLFFAGDGHEARACTSAWGMRARLRELGRPSTSVGAVTLRMHVGIHSGLFDVFLVGDRHRELIVTGPGAGVTVAMEAAAEAGEIAVSAGTAAALDPRSLGRPVDDGFLLAASPDVAPTGIDPIPDVAELDLLGCVPEAVRDQVTAGRVESEHRQATVGFLRFAGLETLLEHDRGEASAAVEEVVTAVQGAAAEHGVCFLESDVDRDGGRIVLVAGAPSTAGDDEERMLRTLRAVVEAGTRLELHAGVSRGRVFAGPIGPPFRRTYTILGSTAALAARLMAKAGAGEIYATPDVVERSRTRFDTRPLEPLVLKGKQRPVDAVSVGRIGGAREAKATRRLPLVGRARELAILGAATAPVRLGFGSFVELVGEAGIGKSRLVEEVREQSSDLKVAGTACDPYEASTPYYPFRSLLRSLLGVSFNGSPATNTKLLRERLGPATDELDPWLPLVGLVLDVQVEPTRETDELEPSFRRARLNGSVEALLQAVLDAPAALLFEDVHWMDDASCDLLRHLGGRVAQQPWLLCTTRRPTGGGFSAADATPPVPALTLRLEALPLEEAKQLVEAAAEEPLPADEVEAIARRADGNPLFLRELITAGREQDVEELPESVEGVVTSRIDALPPEDRALLRWAAVLGAGFSGELVAEVLADDASAAVDAESWDRLAEFVERDPYVPGMFRFRHALIRDAAYEGLSFERRRALHGRVAEVLAAQPGGEGHEELLSLHFFLAERYAEAWEHSLAAGAGARAKFANVEAAGFYRRAIDAARRLPDVDPTVLGEAWEALGDVLELAAAYTEAAEAYREARRLLTPEPARIPALFLKEGRLRESLGRYGDALRWYTRGIRATDALPEPERTKHRTRLGLGYGAARLRQGQLDDCIRWCRRALEDAEATTDLEALAHAYYLLHLAYTTLGSPERKAFRGLALPIYEELGDLLGQANVLNNLGIEAYYEGRWDEALDLYERSRSARERIGDVLGAVTIANNIAELLSDRGELAEAEARFEEVLATAGRAGSTLMTAVATGNLGRAAARAGRADVAAERLRDALASFEEIGAAAFAQETRARLAEGALFAGDFDGAVEGAEGALEDAPPALQALLHRVRGYALHRRGDAKAAAEALATALRIARDGDLLYEAGLTLRAVGDTARDAAAAAEAAEILAQLGVVAPPSIPRG